MSLLRDGGLESHALSAFDGLVQLWKRGGGGSRALGSDGMFGARELSLKLRTAKPMAGRTVRRYR